MGVCKGLTCFVWTGAIATLIITMLMVFNPTMFISVDDVANPETLQSAVADVTNTATTLGWISSGLSALGTGLSIRNAYADKNTINEDGDDGEHKVNWRYACVIIMAGLLLMAAPLLLHMDFGHTIGTSLNSMYFASVACGLVGSFLLIGSRSISTTTPIGDAAQASSSQLTPETNLIDDDSFGRQVGGESQPVTAVGASKSQPVTAVGASKSQPSQHPHRSRKRDADWMSGKKSAADPVATEPAHEEIRRTSSRKSGSDLSDIQAAGDQEEKSGVSVTDESGSPNVNVNKPANNIEPSTEWPENDELPVATSVGRLAGTVLDDAPATFSFAYNKSKGVSTTVAGEMEVQEWRRRRRRLSERLKKIFSQ